MPHPKVAESQGVAAGRRWSFGHCAYVELSRQLSIGNQPVKMESKPLEVLQLLLEQPLQVLTKDELIGAAWSTATTDQSLATAVRKLRKAFGGPRDSIILNVSGIGYRMAVAVTCTIDADPGPPPFRLNPGDPIPFREHWVAARALDVGEPKTVWLVEHKKTHEARVFKFAVDGVRLRALQREVVLSRMIDKVRKDDPRFVRVLDWNFEQSPFFIESNFGGANLFEFSETEDFQQMALDERVALTAEITGAVAEAHGLGILHNDLKPSNVLVTRRGGSRATVGGAMAHSWQIRVVDFGVASLNDPRRLIDLQITHHGEFDVVGDTKFGSGRSGTAMYRAPEQLLPGATPSMRADTYALGVMLYQIICGDFLDPPSPGWEARIPDEILREDIAAAANIDPERRFASAAELAERLANVGRRRAERKEREQERAAAERTKQQVTRARLRRPWIILALGTLGVAFGVCLWFYRGAVKQRNAALSRSATLAAMNKFLTVDLIGQSNPMTASVNSGQVPRETLVEAIDRVLPIIDQRFAGDPEIAAEIHEALGAALDGRTLYAQSDKQFALAAERFREAEGPLSQDAIICELRRENAQVRTQLPGPIAEAKAGFATQEQLIGRLQEISPELQAWAALAETATQIYSATPHQALDVLSAAVQRAGETPGFSHSLLVSLKLRFCGIYAKLGRYGEMERVARDVLSAEKAHNGDTAATFQPEIFLEEALLEQGKYKEAIEQSSHDYQQFSNVLGPNNQLTLASLDVRAQAEGQSEEYTAAIRDELALHAATASVPSGLFMAEDSLNMAAQLACRNGNYSTGIGYARQVLQETSSGPMTQPHFSSAGSLAIAECLLSREESRPRPDPATLEKADRLLSGVNLSAMEQSIAVDDSAATLQMAKARLDLLRGRVDRAKEEVAKAVPTFSHAGADPYEAHMLARVESQLQRTSSQRPQIHEPGLDAHGTR